ncbi:hypothetical protein Bca52824_025927 [Brassica carinata]|uniref:Uncharacterized protein n=1 Tax=Brassica carinata TaxID=52824 RepID=A0A8X7V8C5_BRACI|nr:hypothetical protein Bca52824_025927 [Brassica carinata]
MLKDQFFQQDQKVAKLEKIVALLSVAVGHVNQVTGSSKKCTISFPSIKSLGVAVGHVNQVTGSSKKCTISFPSIKSLGSYLSFLVSTRACFSFLWLSELYSSFAAERRRSKQAVEAEDAEPEVRPVGVKAAKAGNKRKKSGKEEEMSQLQSIMEVKEKISKQKILERLLAKKDPLSEMEESLKLKLMTEML